MISIIICSINEVLLTQLSKNIEQTIGTEYEIIAINNAKNKYSIAAAYNLGASQAKYPYLCFVHEDILFHTQNWGYLLKKHLDNSAIALVGIFGSLIKTKVPSGVHIAIQDLNRVNQLQRNSNSPTAHFYENPLDETYSEVAVLDGMFLATTAVSHNKCPFDEHLLRGFHGYDIDYSLGQAGLGKIVVIYDILLEHFSHGGNSTSWIDEQLKVINKWQNSLPQYVPIGKKDLRIVTIKNLEVFLMALLSNNYKKGLQLKYLLQLIRLQPFNLKNPHYIRRFLIYGKTEHWFKKIYRLF